MEGTAESLIVPRVNDQPKESQLVLFESDSDSVLPDILPFHQLWDGKSKKQTKGGAVSHGARVMDEAFFPLERGEIKAELDFELGVLLGAYTGFRTRADHKQPGEISQVYHSRFARYTIPWLGMYTRGANRALGARENT